MKKRWIILSVLAVLLLFIFFPRPLSYSDDPVITVYYNTEHIKLSDSDAAELKEIITDAHMIFAFDLVPTPTAEEYPIEINVNDNGRIRHVILGEKNICYKGNDVFYYALFNGKGIYEQVSALMPR